MPRVVIVFQPLDPDVTLPTRGTVGSAGFDLRARIRGRKIKQFRSDGSTVTVECDGDRYRVDSGARILVPLGFCTELPVGFEVQIRARSSVAVQRGLIIPNAPATIDTDYRAEWMVPLLNLSSIAVEVIHNERIAQAVVMAYGEAEWRIGIPSPSTRAGGFGSTGPD